MCFRAFSARARSAFLISVDSSSADAAGYDDAGFAENDLHAGSYDTQKRQQ